MISIRFTSDADVRDDAGSVVQRFRRGQLMSPAEMTTESMLYWLDAGMAEVVDPPALRARRRKATVQA